MGGEDPTTQMLKQYMKSWTDKLRYKKIKLQKLIKRSRQIMDNANLKRDKKNFFKKVERGTNHVGQILEMEKNLGTHMEKDDRTLEMPWMEKLSEQLRKQIANVKEFNIIEENLDKETKGKIGLHQE